ncbi:restriction endonuclease subunit S [Weissella viridescens]|uniref:restriction endonuclease subunit S n=1 Tax=Weissella viridescens TaxID=1629 RepID=UPI001C7CCB95|nr:restriction endonuclease subunit S [Weissella viridescens]MBX4172985.1 restriction endonuclease subunit S [Weissella viridescens]
MNNERNNVPALRFPGFTNPWEKRKLGEAVNVRDTLRVPITSNVRIPGNTPYYGANGIQDFVKGYTHTGENVLVAEDGANDLRQYPALYTEGPIWVNNHAHVLSSIPNLTDNLFLSYRLKIVDFIPFLSGSGRSKLNASELNKITTWYPSIVEQTKIGEFFKKLDDLIAVNQREGKKLEDLKKAYLDKLFPKGGNDKPELRFPGFTNPWEKRKLNDISTIYSGGTPSSAKAEYWNGTINWFTPTEVKNNGYIKNSVRKITKSGLKHSSAVLLPKDSIMMTSRAGIGEMAILNEPATTNQGIQSFVLKSNISPYFFYSMQPKISKLANIVASGSTFTEISGKKLGNILLMFTTNKEEQTKIGEFFKKLDDLIAVNQREGEKLEQLKKAYLKDMFV